MKGGTMPDKDGVATLKETMVFFDIKASDFLKEWKELSEESKAQIRKGIGDKSLDY